jgi:DNA mismatch endonuclease (patch repair protein)
MVDFLTPAERSARMSRIKGRDTRPEKILRRVLYSLGLRYRLNRQDLPGKPDLVFSKYKAVVFVHGCFWHRHVGCNISTTPKSNSSFWLDKFDRNVARDIKVVEALTCLGWRVFVVWECELGSEKKALLTGARIAKLLRGDCYDV